MKLRDYQLDVARETWRAHERGQRVLIRAATGTGKTVVASFYMQQRLRHSRWRMVFMAHRRELIHQTVAKLRAMGMDAGIIMSGYGSRMYEPIQVCSIDTIHARRRTRRMELPEAQLVIVDEAHRCMGNKYKEVLHEYQARGAKILGLTATPVRSDGQGMGLMFDTMVETPDVSWMIENKFLVPVRYKVGIMPDVSGVKINSDGDYDRRQLEQAVNQKILVGDVVDNWLKFASDRPTMVFASGVQHSQHICQQFQSVGVAAAHIDAHTDPETRANIAHDLESRRLQVVTNAMVYVEGTDIPCVSCIVFAQPSRSVGKYLQQGGRGLRPAEGKENLLCLDHAGVVMAHGRLEDERVWTLTTGKKGVVENVRKDKERKDKECPACHEVFRGSVCPACGWMPKHKGKDVETLSAELIDLDAPQQRARRKSVDPSKFYGECLNYSMIHKLKPGWVEHMYKSKFGSWPPRRWREEMWPLITSSETLNYIRHRQIAYSMSQRRKSA